MTIELPMRHRFVIANMAAPPDRLYLGQSKDHSGYEWVRSGSLKDILTFDEHEDAVAFSRGLPGGPDFKQEVICAWMPSVDEILDALDVPMGGRDDVKTLKGAIGDLWVRAVLEVERARAPKR